MGQINNIPSFGSDNGLAPTMRQRSHRYRLDVDFDIISVLHNISLAIHF